LNYEAARLALRVLSALMQQLTGARITGFARSDVKR
jgi:hypothetical protein